MSELNAMDIAVLVVSIAVGVLAAGFIWYSKHKENH